MSRKIRSVSGSEDVELETPDESYNIGDHENVAGPSSLLSCITDSSNGGGGSDTSVDGTLAVTTSHNQNGSMMDGHTPSVTSSISAGKGSLNITHNTNSSCRFPKLEDCAHFHYGLVEIGDIVVRLVDDKTDLQSNILSSTISSTINDNVVNNSLMSTTSTASNYWCIIKVITSETEPFLIKRSFDNLKMLDKMIHECVYDRKVSGLTDLQHLQPDCDEQLEEIVAKYLCDFSKLGSKNLTCGSVLTWLQLDNKGRRLPLADTDTMRSINTPAVGAAYGVRRYVAQASDEISIEVGDMISVIDMPSPAESIWWRGKKSHMQKSQYEVGFFPQNCVATIGDKVPRHLPLPAPFAGSLDVSPTKPVLRKHGKLIAFFRSFILSRPSRRRLKQTGIYKERVFSCDLSEHLLNSEQDIPMVLKCCAEFIEEYGIVDGIYRLSGITSNIQKLRRSFDEERVPDFSQPDIKQDIHAVGSLLKMYFRELPNPLCTYQLYDHFVEAIQKPTTDANQRLELMKKTVEKLPPPHYRTLKYLATHLNKIGQLYEKTGMTDRNLAIVWAPNLLRSPALESGGVAALRGVGVQAVVTEYLITNCKQIFDADEAFSNKDNHMGSASNDSATDSDGVEQRNCSVDMMNPSERPKSLNVGGAKLISLEEAQVRQSRNEMLVDPHKAVPINNSLLTQHSSYIEVGGGPASLPDKYHTVLPVPRSWQKRKTTSWKSLFTRNSRQSNSNSDIKSRHSANGTKLPIDSKLIGHPKLLEEKAKLIALRGKSVNGINEESRGHRPDLKLNKSMDEYSNYTGRPDKPLDVIIRSNSIDSLRTVGHSRSVSHDSYFDLLQSPLRGTNCPSRELSELGINFDREEDEMRIFSESESLVSSPKVPKEVCTRRGLRGRPEDYSSPKKQPRLNILTSPTIDEGPDHWIEDECELMQIGNDESQCKRYKLEDQLSDIQYIDCNTPEHTITNAGSLYITNQLRQQKSSDTKKNTTPLDKIFNPDSMNLLSPTSRYSYPRETDQNKNKNTSRLSCNELESKSFISNIPVNVTINSTLLGANASKSSTLDSNRLSAATPSSAGQSPRYSILCTDNSSEASSALTTPTLDPMDILSSIESQGFNLTNIPYQNAKDNQKITNQINLITESKAPVHDREVTKLKRDLSLDLTMDAKMSEDGGTFHKLPIIKPTSTPNTPNITSLTSENTSQSITPSEFSEYAYQNLNKQHSMESSPNKMTDDDDESSKHAYENLVSSFGSYSHPKYLPSSGLIPKSGNVNPTAPLSPIKSTISITYNIKSPAKKSQSMDHEYANVEVPRNMNADEKRLLETSFDDSGVYEQVKFFKGMVSEVNQIIDSPPESIRMETSETSDAHNVQVVPDIQMCLDKGDHSKLDTNKGTIVLCDTHKTESNEDVRMSSDQDSLEFANENLSLYENVELDGQPKSVYENVDLRKNAKPDLKPKSFMMEGQNKENIQQKIDSRPGNFIVRQLATRFETSPVENVAPFDFSKVKKPEENPNSFLRPKVIKDLNKTTKITRSLDENAFVREFGNSGQLTLRTDIMNRSDHQISDTILNENSPNRRKSIEYMRPKSLNPPKLLPNLTDNETNSEKNVVKVDEKITPVSENRIALVQQNLNSQQQEVTRSSADEDDMSQSSLSSTLGGYKLDRERIEKIKEERRLQLSERFRSNSLRGNSDEEKTKSKSKSELSHESKENNELMKAMSKSRNSLKDIDIETKINRKKTTGSTEAIDRSKLGVTNLGHTRRISDEKNQNDLVIEDSTKGSHFKSNEFLVRDRPTELRMLNTSNKTQKDRISPQYSIRDMTAMFESRSQNQ